jgi:HD-GYP domain-containing protein (c-di-GMP phosphodiesterase class II)
MLEPSRLARDLVDWRGAVLAPAGTELSVASIRACAASAVAAPTRPLADTFAASDLRLPLAAPVYRHLFRDESQDATAHVLLAAELPDALWDELRTMRAADPARYWHALATAAVAARMLLGALGEATSIARAACAGLLHDLGMRHVSPHLSRNGDLLSALEREEVAAHPLLGAYHLALLLGDHPAVEAALGHHWAGGAGYPPMPSAPPRSVGVVAVASVFAALTQPRPFRSAPYDARGAADVLVVESLAGRADPDAVRLLVHALRNGKGDLRALRFGRERIGHAPAVNRHTPIAARLA